MATHPHAVKSSPRDTRLDPNYRRAVPVAYIIGGIGLALCILISYYFSAEHVRRFYFAYLVNYLFFLTIALGGLYFVLMQHLTRAGWSVGVRRISETLASTLPVMFALSAPILLSVILQKGDLYRWAQPVPAHVAAEHESANALTQPAEHGAASAAAEHSGEMPVAEPSIGAEGVKTAEASADPTRHGIEPLNEEILAKRVYLNPAFFIARIVIYFTIWSIIAIWYLHMSLKQDETADPMLSLKMQARAAPLMVVFAVTLTLAAFDLVMSLDATWYSTMFGVYFFAGCAGAIHASLILISRFLQARGKLRNTISIEHYHDLGKFLFAFTFFWGYIAFSQYMLIWYGNIPEEVGWMARRGATTVAPWVSAWSIVILIILFCRLIIPFAGLLSRHVKRNRYALIFWAAWILVFHWLDLYWMTMPELDGKFRLGFPELFGFIGVGGLFVGSVLRVAVRHELRPINDPRLAESLAFQNI